MGYAQVSGLPAVYGLYGSLLPILVYGLITSSPASFSAWMPLRQP